MGERCPFEEQDCLEARAQLAAANARADAAEKALETMKDRDYEPIKKWIQTDAPEAVRRAYAIMVKAETERDTMKEALAAARRECEELRESLLVGVATHGEPCSKGEDCQFMVEARVALAAPACLGAPKCLFSSLRAHSIDCPLYPLAPPGAAAGEEET